MQLDQPVPQALQAQPELLVPLGLQELLVQPAQRVPLVQPVPPAQRVPLDQPVRLARLVQRVLLDQPVRLARLVQRAPPALQELQVRLVPLEKLVPPVILVQPDQPVPRVQPVQRDLQVQV